MANWSPFMDQINLPTANTRVQLSAALAAIDANLPTRMMWVRLEDDQSNGAGNTFVGGSNVSSAHAGFHLVASQEAPVVPPSMSGLILTTDIWIVSDQNNRKINVTALPIGA